MSLLSPEARATRPQRCPQIREKAVEMLKIELSANSEKKIFSALACPIEASYIPTCVEHGAQVGRSRSRGLYEKSRKARGGKSAREVDESATGSTNLFWGPRRPSTCGSA